MKKSHPGGYLLEWSDENELKLGGSEDNHTIDKLLVRAKDIVGCMLNMYNSHDEGALHGIFAPDVEFSINFRGLSHPFKKTGEKYVPIKFTGSAGIKDVMTRWYASTPDVIMCCTGVLVSGEGNSIKASLKFNGTKVYSLLFPMNADGHCACTEVHAEADPVIRMVHCDGCFDLTVNSYGVIQTSHLDFWVSQGNSS